MNLPSGGTQAGYSDSGIHVGFLAPRKQRPQISPGRLRCARRLRRNARRVM